MKSFSALALEDFPLVKAGDDLARIILETAQKNGVEIEDEDVIVVAQKVVSKAEKRTVRLKDVRPSKKAFKLARTVRKSPKFVELVLREAKRVLKATREILLVEDRRRFVCINAAIDKSNVKGAGNFALLPENPDDSAKKCRRMLKELTGKNVAVVISDTFSRPFRRGQVNFAIGLAGINPFKDYRGTEDMFGQVLKVKNVAVADEIAAAAELLMGQGKEARPVVILRGLKSFVDFRENEVAGKLIISKREDLFRNSL